MVIGEDVDMNWKVVGKNIKQCRNAKKMNQSELAERIGVSTNYIGMIERGEKTPSLEIFVALINELEISADMVLKDILKTKDKYSVKSAILDEKLSSVSDKKREMIYEVIEILMKHIDEE